jgi:hypothetical protein
MVALPGPSVSLFPEPFLAPKLVRAEASFGPEFRLAIAGFGFLKPRPPVFAVAIPAPVLSAFPESFVAMNAEYGAGEKPVRPEFSFAVVARFGFLKPGPSAAALRAPPVAFPESFVAMKFAKERPLRPELTFAAVAEFVLLLLPATPAATSATSSAPAPASRRRTWVWRRSRRWGCRRLRVAGCLERSHGVRV